MFAENIIFIYLANQCNRYEGDFFFDLKRSTDQKISEKERNFEIGCTPPLTL
jgi:hypothetical protein